MYCSNVLKMLQITKINVYNLTKNKLKLDDFKYFRYFFYHTLHYTYNELMRKFLKHQIGNIYIFE